MVCGVVKLLSVLCETCYVIFKQKYMLRDDDNITTFNVENIVIRIN